MSTLGMYGPAAVRRLPINATGTGDLIIIPAITGKRFIILTVMFTSKKAAALTVKSWVANLISGPIEVLANQSNQWRDGLSGLFETQVGEPLVFNLTGTNHTLGGFISFCEF
jgi:hypothetical protein